MCVMGLLAVWLAGSACTAPEELPLCWQCQLALHKSLRACCAALLLPHRPQEGEAGWQAAGFLHSFGARQGCLPVVGPLLTKCKRPAAVPNSCVCANLQEMRTYKEAEQAGKNAGFDLVMSYDIATASPVSGPW